VALHAQSGDVIALPDHAITAVVGYYLASDSRRVPLWPQLGVRQRYVEGMDLSPDPSSISPLPHRVWLVTGGSGPGIEHFQRNLSGYGYVLSKEKQFTAVTLFLYHLAWHPITGPVALGDGATASGKIPLYALVSDSTTVKRLVFQATGSSLHNAIIGTATPIGFGWVTVWDSTKVANGYYMVRSVVVRPDGTSAFSSPIRIRVENKPGGS
jgi:hypothetical protein